ncbi:MULTISPECIES: TIGR01212 family radical SAM protein [Staphylococcaceae]|uniref:TIGR01212 family radical SAM protein n=3 Tax=Bacillales TaxID=1385 RepID=A0A855GT29_9STAP|nr:MULTISPECIES: TIGR01212 family radical SAM protein [Macrococcus]MDJ1111596.1 TIGR01212 family radical SAM protein [Macrococcus sp. S115]PKE17932.1 TIGR01212 family radical SAM protein [Macrococcus caseolyticus]PKE21563.1 TIGR01212 family radical SAM protein [Macrococcus caseolyticus]PKE25935.1 TIGR01212 family radical SAM protein [Macrococcus caseolyticus]PKE36421.1 TIGR01212 family radical SAM protein [Macrococcus caseolyticus]
MMKPFKYAFDEKRYHTWNYHLRNKFGKKIFKVALEGGFDCPNRDGTVAFGGCTFCSAAGSGDFAGDRVDPIPVQFEKIKNKMHEKWQDGEYIAYFQAFTNTHAPLEVLKEKYEAALAIPGVVGLSIATRPDCLPDDVVEYLAELNERTYLWVELGLQTVHEKTSNIINRAHDMQCYYDGVAKLRKHNINICTHIINGLPLEDYDMMMETARVVSQMDVQGIKIHLLHLLKGTPMVKQYEKGMLEFMDQETYVKLVADQLEILPEEMIIHRITGDGPIDLMIGPMWSVNKWEVLNGIDDELKKRDSYQGKYFGIEQ